MAQQSWSDSTTFVYAANVQELMDAINEWEDAYDITPTSFTNDPVAGKPIRSLDISEMQDALDDLKNLVDGDTFSWTSPTGKIINAPIKQVQNHTNYLQDGKCYLCNTCDDYSCSTCNNTCNAETCTSCNTSYYNRTCTTCYNSCYSQTCGSCHTYCYGYNKCNDMAESCTCNSACYQQTCTVCNNTCNSQTCTICNNTCYNEVCTTCDNTCYSDTCTQCHVTANVYPFT